MGDNKILFINRETIAMIRQQKAKVEGNKEICTDVARDKKFGEIHTLTFCIENSGVEIHQN